MKSCPSCGAEAAPDAGFCPRCGTAFAPACTACGAPLPPGARFCPACAHPVADPAKAEERKLVTVLFADVTGYTSLGEKLDAERLKEVMDSYFAAMREAIEAEGGTVEKFIGDAVMAVFGAPVAHEDDPVRALRAALGMRRRLETLNEALTASHGVALEMRIGVNSGEVMAPANPEPGTGLVTGDVVSVAARLEQTAEPGEVLVAERVARATRGFSFAEVGALSLKGKGHPVRALRLLAEDRATERGIPGLSAPLVGRDSEMRLLDSLFERVAAEAHPHLVTVYGDPGVGKSRLVAEFIQKTEAHGQAPLIVGGRCLPYGEGVTYSPLAEILKNLAGVLDTDPSELTVEKIRKLGRDWLTSDVADEPARATAALAYTVGVDDPELSFRDLSPRQVRIETHAAWRSFFSGLASDRPVVALIEDIHWADSALLDLLEELADRLHGPVLLVCPARPELTQRRPTWGGGKRNFSSIFLDPLTRDGAMRLVEFLLAIEDLPDDVHQQILARGEGNPFFLEEIIRHLIDEGRIVHQQGRWRGTAECEEVVIPDTVQGVLAARIDLLSPEEKRVAQYAAVVGRVFWKGPVQRLIGDGPGAVDEVLDRLESRELISARLSSSIGGDREFIFKHVLTRDVAYESLPRRDRATAHGRVAEWLRETAGERRREFAELLAHHFTEAHRLAGADLRTNEAELERLRSSALEHVLLASEVARDRFVINGAKRLGEAALGLARNGLERSAALEALGLAYQFDYVGDDAWRCLKQAVDEVLAVGIEDDRKIARLCATALETPTRWPGSIQAKPPEEESRRYLDLGMSHGERIEGDSPELARMLIVKSLWLFGYAEGGTEELFDQSVADGQRAADMAHRLGLPELESAALDGAGSAWMLRGLYRQADEVGERRLELVPKIRDWWELGDLYSVHAWVQFMLGKYQRAVHAGDEGVRLTQDFVPGVAIASLTWRALARFRLGDWDGALGDQQRIQELLGERGRVPMFASRPYGVAALIREIRGNAAAADELMTVLAKVEPARDGTGGSSPWLTPLLMRRGRFKEALALIDEALANRRWPGMLGPMYESLCDALGEVGEWDRARKQAPFLREYGERGGFATMPFSVDRMEGRDAFASGDLRRAAELLARSAAGYAELGVVWEEAHSLVYLAEALIGLGRAEESSAALARADEVYERLGDTVGRTRARELLG